MANINPMWHDERATGCFLIKAYFEAGFAIPNKGDNNLRAILPAQLIEQGGRDLDILYGPGQTPFSEQDKTAYAPPYALIYHNGGLIAINLCEELEREHTPENWRKVLTNNDLIRAFSSASMVASQTKRITAAILRAPGAMYLVSARSRRTT